MLRTNHADAGFARNVAGSFTATMVRERPDGQGLQFEGVMTFNHVSPPAQERVRGMLKDDQFILWRHSAGGQRWRGRCIDASIRGDWSTPNRPVETGPFLISR